MKIWANVIVNNEDQFIWYSIMSAIDFVDKILIYDMGSTDRTVEIINKITQDYPNKIVFKEVGKVDKYEFTKMRQKMLQESKCDWIMILDGDEIWWKKNLTEIKDQINSKGDKIEGIVVPFYMLIGDIYHYQEELAGQYNLLDRKGHLSLRFISKKIPGLHADLPYGSEGYYDSDNVAIDKRKKIIFSNTPYLHASHLTRSSKKRDYDKAKTELGIKFSDSFNYPEVFSANPPNIVPNIKKKISKLFLVKSIPLTFLRKVKRRLIWTRQVN